MTHPRLQDATRIVRNTIGLLLVSLIAKGSGLIIVIVVARYLGAEALGVYVVIMALTMLLAAVSPMGTPDVAIRAVSRDHSTMLRHWVESAFVTVLFATLFGLCLALGSRLIGIPAEAQTAVDIAAVALLPGGLMLASQAPLQALERMKYLTICAFVGRIAGLSVLVVMLESGAGIASAMVSHLVFVTLTVILLAMVIIRYGRAAGATKDWDLSSAGIVQTVFAALPFAGQRVLAEAVIRINLIILPLLVSVQSVGWFDAADRIRRTIAVVIPITMLAVMPEFSRAFAGNRKQAIALAQRTMKFLLIAIFPLVLLLVVAAPQIISLLYGSDYERSVPVLRIGVWSLLFLGADMVLKQIMIASHEERALLWRSLCGMAMLLVSTVILAKFFGILGVAASISLASVFVMMLDAKFVTRRLGSMNLKAVAAKPLLSAAAAGSVALLLSGENLIVVVAVSGAVYVASLALCHALTSDEWAVIRQIPANLLRKN